MDALADYSSDDDNSDLRDVNAKKKSGGLQGDNYENVTMELSEGSDDNNKESSRGSKESEKSDRSKSGRRHDERRERRTESRHPKSSKHSRNRDDRRDDRDKRDKREDRYKSEKDRKRSRRSRSRSRSPRRRSRSRDRVRDRNRDFKFRRSSTSTETVPASTSAVEKEGSLSPPLVCPETVNLSSGIVPGLTNNPTLARIQDQLQKRRALWSNKSTVAKETCAKSGNNWESTHLPKDGDGKMTAKFKRLMGMKDAAEVPAEPIRPEKPVGAADLQKKQDEMFNSMERQYEVARLATHTHRGIGLGFGTFQCNPR